MTWSTSGRNCITGLAGEIPLEGLDASNSTPSYVSGRILLPTNTASATSYLRLVPAGTAILGLGTHVNHIRIRGLSVSAAPSVKIPLLSDNNPTGAYVWIKPDQTIGIYDNAGTNLGSTTGTIPITGVAEKDVDIIIDGGIGTCGTVVFYVYLNGALDLTLDTGESWATFTNSGAHAIFVIGVVGSASYGCNITFNQAMSRFSTDPADLPYASALPQMIAVGGNSNIPATAEATFNWTNSTTPSPNTWQDISETGAHSGDTGSIWDSQTTDPKTAHVALYTYSALNPIPGGATPDFVQLKHWQKLLGAGKDAATFSLKYGSTTESKTIVDNAISSSAYAPESSRWDARPGGGAWAQVDAAPGTVAFGATSVVAVGVNTGPRIDKMTIEWVYHTATLPMATNPCVSSIVGRRQGIII